MAEAVYVLCFVTSVLCAAMLFRGYRANRTRLLFWSALCFAGWAVNNALMLLDLLVLPDIDLRIWRTSVATVALFVIVHGLVGEAR